MEEGTDDIVPQDIISDEIKLHAKSSLTGQAEKVQKYFEFQDMSRSKVFDLLNKGHLKNVNLTFNMKKVVEEINNELNRHGKINLVCVYSDVSECNRQFGAFYAYSNEPSYLKLNKNITVITFTNKAI